MKSLILVLTMFFSLAATAEVKWTEFSEKELVAAIESDKKVVLGFHKRGCGTCHSQDASLVKTGITNDKNFVFLKVERYNSKHTEVYEKFGFSNRQWAALVAVDREGIIAEVNPGNTNYRDISAFSRKAIRGRK